ncbi:4-hydroxy-2-ketovalerate aldolase [Stappia sp. 22II-S9-Z10]|nr:4-hydroxy-2-ketovalerate aldolase [Stappia sp. 22II-S9-Z10]
MSDLPKTCHIMEVGPRDGLQIEPKVLTVEEKLRLIDGLEKAGFTEIEAGSFVNPKAVPQMANTPEVFAGITPKPGVLYRALWLNAKGLERAVTTPNVAVDGVLHLTASEVFVKRNTNRSIAETFEQLPSWIELYRTHGIPVDSMGVMAAFGCNFEGNVPPERVVDIIARTRDIIAEHGGALKYVNLADTMGWAVPDGIKRLCGMVQERWPELELKLHLHDTRGMAMANALAGLEAGVAKYDGSIAGLGGCPFAGHKGAAGNICSEDLAFMCAEMGIDTGLDLDALIEVAALAEELVGRTVPGKVMKGGSLERIRHAVAS